MADVITELHNILELHGDTYSSAEVLTALRRARAEIERLRAALTKIAEFPGQISDAGWEMHGIANRALNPHLGGEQ